MSINDTLNEVTALLKEQVAVQQGLLALSREKREAVAKNDTERLSEIVHEEYRLLSSMNSIEKKRVAAMSEARAGLEGQPGELRLSELIAVAPPEHRLRLSDLGKELAGAIGELKAQNESNRGLIETQLEYTNMMLEIIGGSNDPLNNFYGTDGRSSDAEITRGSSVFDAEI